MISKENRQRRLQTVSIMAFGVMASLSPMPISADANSNQLGLPAQYQGYEIDEFSRSPDGQFAVIVPSVGSPDQQAPQNYLVSIDPVSVIKQLPTKATTWGTGHPGSLVVKWGADSSSAVMYVMLKWAPEHVFVVSVSEKRDVQITDLDCAIRSLLDPEFIKSGASPFNETFNYVFDSELESGSCWTIDSSNHVVVDCVATTDPRNVPPSSHWTAHFQGKWDIKGKKFVKYKITTKMSEDNE